ncbi:MAG TPA: quinohemoprotein amine dehydrogenase, partial [Sneathiellales bacterium]|nr:quinohemoprotein amine dehydrogenase [Sneathiellales bacterium]
MKHLKPLNNKAELLEKAVKEGKTEEVFQMTIVAGCTATLDPG